MYSFVFERVTRCFTLKLKLREFNKSAEQSRTHYITLKTHTVTSEAEHYQGA